MPTKAKRPTKRVARPASTGEEPGPGSSPPGNLQERLKCITFVGQRIDAHIRFMCQVSDLTGISTEAKERAVTAFYERIVVVEKQLGRIQDDLRLE